MTTPDAIAAAISEHGALAVYTAAHRHSAGAAPDLSSVGLTASTMGDVWRILDTAYSHLTEAEKAIDYAKSTSLLAARFSRS